MDGKPIFLVVDGGVKNLSVPHDWVSASNTLQRNKKLKIGEAWHWLSATLLQSWIGPRTLSYYDSLIYDTGAKQNILFSILLFFGIQKSDLFVKYIFITPYWRHLNNYTPFENKCINRIIRNSYSQSLWFDSEYLWLCFWDHQLHFAMF